MNNAKILFVDDNSVNLIVAENLMRSLGISIEKAYDGETAIKMATTKEYELIFMDLLMPNMDGYMATKLLRRNMDQNYKTKIIATSGFNKNEVDEQAYVGLFEEKIGKPLKIEELKACLERFLSEEHLVQLHMFKTDCTKQKSTDEWKGFMHEIEHISDIKLEYFLEFETKDIDYFLRLMKSSRKQLNQSILTMKETILSGNDKTAHEQLHALKSVLYYVGAHTLSSMAAELDQKLIGEKNLIERPQRFAEIMPNYKALLDRITILCNELEQAILAYNSSIKNVKETFNDGSLSLEEISKRIEQILFHVARYEYIEIFNGLNYLMNKATQEMKPYINQALAALEEFEYEKVEESLKDCWNEILKR